MFRFASKHKWCKKGRFFVKLSVLYSITLMIIINKHRKNASCPGADGALFLVLSVTRYLLLPGPVSAEMTAAKNAR
jgi:hypothetical protein